MCEPRKEGEPWIAYAFRYAVELTDSRARSVLTVICLAAACWFYHDLRTLILAQTESYRAISLELRELNIRISNLELREGIKPQRKESYDNQRHQE